MPMISGNMAGYQWSDAWLLLAISVAGGTKPADLHEIIAAGDGINHALFTYDEVHDGLRRLGQGGWIQGTGGKLNVTSKFKKAPLPSSRTWETSLDQIETLLKQQRPPRLGSSALARKRLKSLEISQQSFEEAVDRYQQWFSTYLQSHSKKRARHVC